MIKSDLVLLQNKAHDSKVSLHSQHYIKWQPGLEDLPLNVRLLQLNNGGLPSIHWLCCCSPEPNILSALKGLQIRLAPCNINNTRMHQNINGNQNSVMWKIKSNKKILHLSAPYLYLDLKKCSPPLSDLQPVLLWTCCPWKRDVMHLRLHRFILWQTLPSALQSPGCAQARESAVCSIKIPFYSKLCSPIPPELTNKRKCQ